MLLVKQLCIQTDFTDTYCNNMGSDVNSGVYAESQITGKIAQRNENFCSYFQNYPEYSEHKAIYRHLIIDNQILKNAVLKIF